PAGSCHCFSRSRGQVIRSRVGVVQIRCPEFPGCQRCSKDAGTRPVHRRPCAHANPVSSRRSRLPGCGFHSAWPEEAPVIDSRSYRLIRGFVLVLLLFSSCTRAPSFDILGSFFPAWLVCFAAAVLFTVVARLVLLRLRIAIVLPTVTYACLTASCTFLLWLLFFR